MTPNRPSAASSAATRRRSAALLVFTMIVVASCASSDEPDAVATDISTPVDDKIADTTADSTRPPVGAGSLAGAMLDTDTAEELDLIRFTGVDTTADLSELELLLTAADADPESLVIYLDDEGLYTSLPLHPVTPGHGGAVELQLVDGDSTSALLPLQLTGLPAAPGAWDATIDAMTTELEVRARAAGTTLAELQATSFEQVPDDLAAAWLLAGYVDDGTQDDLESLVTSPGADLTDEGRALVDAIVAKIDPFQVVTLRTSSGPQGFAGVVAAPASVGVNRPLASAAADVLQTTPCRALVLPIANGAELASAVEIGVNARAMQGGVVDKLVQDVNALSDRTALIPGIGQFVGAVQTLYATAGLWLDLDAGRYPTSFTALSVTNSPGTFNEDFTKPGTITDVTVVAASTGFDASKEFSDIATQVVGGVAGAATNAVKGDDVFDNLAEASIVAGEQLRNSLTGKLIARLANDLGKGQLVFCPQEWDVDITDPDYVDVSVVIGRLQADKRAFTYEPLELGDDILRVQTRGEVFSGLRISTDIAVSTKRLQVAVSPSKVLVARPGDTVPIAAQLVNADTTTLSWNTPHGKWADELGAITAEDGTRGLVTPTDVSVYPFTVEIESTSTTGLRAGATDVRGDIVVIDLQGLFVAPDPGSVLTRQQLQFAATDRDGKARAVTWTATGGSINGTGLYTAGKVPGVYTVTAVALDDPTLRVTVTVTVGDGDCLVGTWLLRDEEFLDAIAAGSGTQITKRSGNYWVVINEDGTLIDERQQWSFAIATPNGTIVVTIDGEDAGTWFVDGDQLTITDQGGTATVTMEIEVNGQLMPLPGGAPPVDIGGVAGTGTYRCENDVLTVTFDGVTNNLDYLG